MKVSICIPCYEMGGNGHLLLDECLESITIQKYDDIEVVISDDSKDDLVYLTFLKFKDRIKTIFYHKNEKANGRASGNLNNAMEKASGDIIKILFQDDLLYSQFSVSDVVNSFLNNPESKWIATSCCHTYDGKITFNHRNPILTGDIIHGNNQIGSPSVIALKKDADQILEFDPNFNWLMDCDFYYRMIKYKGDPKLINIPTVVIRRWNGQMTETISQEEKDKEHLSIIKKYSITE